MNIQRRYFLTAGASFGLLGLSALLPSTVSTARAGEMEKFEVTRSDAEWKSLLSASAYTILRHEGTEQPYSSPLNSEHRAGIFECAGCAKQLFSSKTKFDSHTGWPSFWQPLDPRVIETRTDSKFFMTRVEVHCARCNGHQGHVFDDGPPPTGLRYCINGVSLKFVAS